MPFATPAIPASGKPLFATVLRPNRSLNARGFRWVIGALGTLSAAVGLVFLSLGAWPVLGFLGLDVLAVYHALRLSNRAGRAAEEISVSRDRLTVRKVAPDGRASVISMNPYWARLEVHRAPPFGIMAMAIASHGRSLPIATFIGPGERETLAEALTAALAEVRATARESGGAPA
jgi:uncharacterized membrane protein